MQLKRRYAATVMLTILLAAPRPTNGTPIGVCRAIRSSSRKDIPQLRANEAACAREVRSLRPNSQGRQRATLLYTQGRLIESMITLGAWRGGGYRDALKLYQMSVDAHPLHFVLTNLGVLQHKLGDPKGALASHLQSAKVHPNPHVFWLPYINLALEYHTLGRAEDALDAYLEGARRGMAMNGRRVLEMATQLPFVYSDSESFDFWRKRFRASLVHIWLNEEVTVKMQNPMASLAFRNAPGYYQLSYFGHNDAPFISLLYRIIKRAAPSLAYRAPGLAVRAAWPGRQNQSAGQAGVLVGRKIRVGFISNFLRRHASGYMISGVIPFLPRSTFDVVIFNTVRQGLQKPPQDEIARRIQKNAKVVTVPFSGNARALDAARAQVEAEDLDVLVFAELGMEPLNYQLAHSRLAPVQVATHGHASTSGIEGTIDYYVSYRLFEHEDPARAQSHYTEPLVTLDGLVHYPKRALPNASTSRADLPVELPNAVLEGRGSIYLCVQTLYKITPRFDSVWRQILDRDRTGVLVFKRQKYEELDEALMARFKKTMPEALARGQIVFMPSLNDSQWFDLFRLSTVMLDSYPFGGYTTSLEALSVGLPIVTLPHAMLAGKCTEGFLRAMDSAAPGGALVEELVAVDEKDYADKAIRLAHDQALRERVSAQIVERSWALFEGNGTAAVRGWARFLEEAVERAAGRRINEVTDRAGTDADRGRWTNDMLEEFTPHVMKRYAKIAELLEVSRQARDKTAKGGGDPNESARAARRRKYKRIRDERSDSINNKNMRTMKDKKSEL
jgi:predicted O-linked N-acetylglucosamine transferase (SPINDLY family)